MILLTCSTLLTTFHPSASGDDHEASKQVQRATLYCALYVVALGTGGIKPNVSAFGADQFDMSDAKVRILRGRFAMRDPILSLTHPLTLTLSLTLSLTLP